MRALTRREKTIAAVLTGAIVIWLLIILGKNYQQMNADLKDKQEMLAAKIQRQRQLILQEPQMQNTLKALKGHLGQASSDGVETAAMVKIAESMAMSHNVHLVNIQPRRSATQGPLKSFIVEITLDGQWASIVEFVQSLQGAPNLLDIESLQLEKYSEATGSLRGIIVIKRWRML